MVFTIFYYFSLIHDLSLNIDYRLHVIMLRTAIVQHIQSYVKRVNEAVYVVHNWQGSIQLDLSHPSKEKFAPAASTHLVLLLIAFWFKE